MCSSFTSTVAPYLCGGEFVERVPGTAFGTHRLCGPHVTTSLLAFGADPDAHGPPFDVAMDAEAKDVLAVLDGIMFPKKARRIKTGAKKIA